MSDREEREEHIKRLEAALACEEKQFSGKCSKAECDDNCALLYKQGNWGEWKDTLRYAIDSLKTDLKYDLLYEETSEQADKQADKPTTKNNLGVDLILREQAKTAIRDKFKDLPSRVEINTILNELPAVTPQKIGHWIEHDWKEILGEGYYRCSVCNHGYQRYTKGIRKSDVPYINGKEYTLWNIDNYCPNCGARMIEPQESEE